MTSVVDPGLDDSPRALAPRFRGRESAGARLRAGSGLGLGISVLWLSVLVLLPLAAVVATGFGSGWGAFWHAINDRDAVRALELTVSSSAIVAAANAIAGTLIAWVLVRDDFPGRKLLEVVIDVPFALPTIVAGVVLLSVYGTDGASHIDLQGTRFAVVLALAFVTLPFVVRSVQPVLMELDIESEQAAALLGARPATVFRRIVLPALLPALGSGAGLVFARAMGEYGSVLLITGGLDNTRVSSMYVAQLIENFDYRSAAAVSTVLLAITLFVLVAIDVAQRWAVRRG